MKLLCLGLNHRTAPVEVRERFAVSTSKLGTAAWELAAMKGISEGVVISTCNRTEFYLVAPDARMAFHQLESYLAEKTQLAASVADHFYRLEQASATRHLCQVVSGLNSMILGAGEMSRITAQSLVSRGARSIFVANRSYDRALELAAEMGGSAVRFDEWQTVLERVDVVISSTGCPHAIVHRADVEKARHARKFRPLFFIDIAVPRDIDPAVGEIEEVYLYDIDTLEQLAEEARSRRHLQIEQCERIIDAELAKLKLPGSGSHTEAC